VNEPTAEQLAPPEQRSGMMAAHLLGILGILGALIYWIVTKNKTDAPIVQDQARESLNFQIHIFVAAIVLMVLSVIVGRNLVPIVTIINLVSCILAAVKANKGVVYRYPGTLRLLNK